MRWRKAEEFFFKTVMMACTFSVAAVVALIIATVLARGFSSMSFAMITQTPQGGYYLGKEGGILNAIVGSLLLSGGATILAFHVAMPVVLYMNVFCKANGLLIHLTRFALDVLWGIPSIVYGAFAFIVMVFLGLKASLLSGIIAITFVELPIMARAMDEVIKEVPTELKEASYALGATPLETAFRVVYRQSLPGIITAVLIAFGRGIGDAAAVLFTAGYSDYLPASLFEPVATLPLAIFFQLATPFPEVQNRAYASAFVLTLIILTISFLSRILTKRMTRFVIR